MIPNFFPPLTIVVPRRAESPPSVPRSINPKVLALFPLGTTRRYVVIGDSPLATGGSAAVWKVWTPEGNEAALKIHNIGIELLGYSKTEAKNLKLIKGGPSIVNHQDDFELEPTKYGDDVHENLHIDDDTPRHAILMDLLPCKDTHDLFMGGGDAISFDDLMCLAKQGLEALVYLQSKQMVHKDLKPENCAYDQARKKLTIFDFATALVGKKLSPNDLLGTTFCYRAPEAILGMYCDGGLDVWSLGMVLFELYTKSRLFNINEEQGELSLLHLIQRTTDQGFSEGFAHLAPFRRRYFEVNISGKFVFDERGFCKLISCPDKQLLKKLVLPYLQMAREYPNEVLWHARIRAATKCRGGRESESTQLIALLDGMLKIEQRINAAQALEQFFAADLTSPPKKRKENSTQK